MKKVINCIVLTIISYTVIVGHENDGTPFKLSLSRISDFSYRVSFSPSREGSHRAYDKLVINSFNATVPSECIAVPSMMDRQLGIDCPEGVDKSNGISDIDTRFKYKGKSYHINKKVDLNSLKLSQLKNKTSLVGGSNNDLIFDNIRGGDINFSQILSFIPKNHIITEGQNYEETKVVCRIYTGAWATICDKLSVIAGRKSSKENSEKLRALGYTVGRVDRGMSDYEKAKHINKINFVSIGSLTISGSLMPENTPVHLTINDIAFYQYNGGVFSNEWDVSCKDNSSIYQNICYAAVNHSSERIRVRISKAGTNRITFHKYDI